MSVTKLEDKDYPLTESQIAGCLETELRMALRDDKVVGVVIAAEQRDVRAMISVMFVGFDTTYIGEFAYHWLNVKYLLSTEPPPKVHGSSEFLPLRIELQEPRTVTSFRLRGTATHVVATWANKLWRERNPDQCP